MDNAEHLIAYANFHRDAAIAQRAQVVIEARANEAEFNRERQRLYARIKELEER